MGAWHLAIKDLLQIWRDKAGLFWILAFPLIYAAFFGAVFGGGGDGPAGKMDVTLVDLDQSRLSMALVDGLASNDALRVTLGTEDEAREAVRRGERTAFIVVEPGYGESMGFGEEGEGGIRVGADPSRQTEAGYLQGILMSTWFQVLKDEFLSFDRARDWMRQGREALSEEDADMPDAVREILLVVMEQVERLIDAVEEHTGDAVAGWDGPPVAFAEVAPAEREGEPRSSFEFLFPMALLWSMFGMVMGASLSLVRERVRGTMLRLRVAPLSRASILAGKGLSGFLTSIAVMLILIVVGHFAFRIRIDHPGHLLLAICSTASCFVGITMLLASLAPTEEAAGGSASATMLIMMMIGGGMVPRMAMPGWLQSISHISPFKWGILAMEGATWRTFSVAELLPSCGVLVGVGLACYLVGVLLMRRFEA